MDCGRRKPPPSLPHSLMSYCRFSSSDWKSDVYVYESENGIEVHVAANRFVEDLPPTPRLTEDNAEEWIAAHNRQMEAIKTTAKRPIGGEYDGQSFTFGMPQEAAGFLERLTAVGYRVPDWVVPMFIGGIVNTIDHWETVAAIVDEERKQFWNERIGTSVLPIKGIFASTVNVPGNPNAQVYMLDTNAFSDEMKQKLVSSLAEKFNVPIEDAWTEFNTNGVPILAEHCVVSTSNQGLVFSLMDDEII